MTAGRVMTSIPACTAYMSKLSEEEARIVQDYCLAVRSAPLRRWTTTPVHRWPAPPGTAACDCHGVAAGHAKRGSNWHLAYALERIQRSIQRGLTHTAARWPPIQTAYTLVFRAVHILNNDEQVSAAEVRRRHAQVLKEM